MLASCLGWCASVEMVNFAPLARAVRISVPLRSDRKSTRLNSSHRCISYAAFCLKKDDLRTGNHGAAVAGVVGLASGRAHRHNGLCPTAHVSPLPTNFFLKNPGTTKIYPFASHAALPI